MNGLFLFDYFLFLLLLALDGGWLQWIEYEFKNKTQLNWTLLN